MQTKPKLTPADVIEALKTMTWSELMLVKTNLDDATMAAQTNRPKNAAAAFKAGDEITMVGLGGRGKIYNGQTATVLAVKQTKITVLCAEPFSIGEKKMRMNIPAVCAVRV